MRPLALAVGLLLATALVTLAPSADAGGCTSLKNPSCGGIACLDQDPVYTCLGDSCQYQSDCCRSVGLWCPEVE